MKISDLQRLSQQASEHSAALARVDPKMLSLATETARTLPRIDTSKLVNMTAIYDAAELFRPIVAPQISEAMKEIMTPPPPSFTEALKGIKIMRPPPLSFTEALKGIDAKTPSAFVFVKTLEDLKANQDRIVQAAGALGLPKTFGADVAAALRERPRTSQADFTSRFEATAEEAIATAEGDDVAEIVDKTVPHLDDLSAAARRKLAVDVALMIAAFVMLAAYLSEGTYRNAAGAALAAAAELLRVYWRLTRKFD